jgi:hypothetical protein
MPQANLFRLLIFFWGITIGLFAQKTNFEDKDIPKSLPVFEYDLNKLDTKTAKIPVGNKVRTDFIADSIFQANKKIKFMEGYRILVYAGNDKDEATNAKERLYMLMKDADVYFQYKQPTYRVKLGDYTTRLEAKQVLVKLIAREYPKAIIIQDNILIKR